MEMEDTIGFWFFVKESYFIVFGCFWEVYLGFGGWDLGCWMLVIYNDIGI